MELKNNPKGCVMKKLCLTFLLALLALAGCGEAQSSGTSTQSTDGTITRTLVDELQMESEEDGTGVFTLVLTYSGKTYKNIKLNVTSYLTDERKEESAQHLKTVEDEETAKNDMLLAFESEWATDQLRELDGVTVTSHMTEEAFILDISIDPEKVDLEEAKQNEFYGDLFESIEDYSPESWIKELKSIGYKELGEKGK
jgi:lipoprotein